MAMPVLAPRPTGATTSVAPRPQLPLVSHSESEWAALYPVIETLYILERRKLRYVMRYMEINHGFKASEQMYKKRFTKWGFQRNSKRSATAVRPSKYRGTEEGTRAATRGVRASGTPGSVPLLLELSRGDDLILTVLTSVRTWTVAYHESWIQSQDDTQASRPLQVPKGLPPTSGIKDTNFAFKLVTDLLHRGQGELAGRMARKAFLLVEDTLTLGSPALMWNLLEMMYHIVRQGHARLFELLVTHLLALASRQMPERHPFLAVLRGMRGLVAGLRGAASISGSSKASPSPSLPSFPSNTEDSTSVVDSLPLPGAVLSLLEQAWILNADIIINQFDPRLFELYFRINWDGCSIDPPTALVRAVDQCFNQLKDQQFFREATLAHNDEERRMARRFQSESAQISASPLPDYKALRAKTLAALRERKESILKKWPTVTGDTALSLRILTGLATAAVLEGAPEADHPTAWPHLHAGNVACAVRTLVDLDMEAAGARRRGELLDAVERIRAVVALRGYARGETNPETVREMWLLQDALVAAAEYEEAEEVERDAYRRIEMYVRGIPSGSA